jgi:hypothetical protein
MLFFVASAILFAQVTQTGTIRGFVTDPSAASVPKASVTVVNDTKLVTRTAATGADGGSLFLSLPRGTYEVTAEATGFRKYVQRGIQLNLQSARCGDLEAGTSMAAFFGISKSGNASPCNSASRPITP